MFFYFYIYLIYLGLTIPGAVQETWVFPGAPLLWLQPCMFWLTNHCWLLNHIFLAAESRLILELDASLDEFRRWRITLFHESSFGRRIFCWPAACYHAVSQRCATLCNMSWFLCGMKLLRCSAKKTLCSPWNVLVFPLKPIKLWRPLQSLGCEIVEI